MTKKKESMFNSRNLAILGLIIIALVALVQTDKIQIPTFNIIPTPLDSINVNYEAPAGDSCTDYNLKAEFNNAAGDLVDTWETTCTEDLSGTWTLQHDELSCYWNPELANIDCDGIGARLLEGFCEDDLKGIWTCDMDRAYVGCRCGTSLPPTWEPEEENCWWQTIDQINTIIPAQTRVEFKNTLPVGKFMWSWDLTYKMDIEIIKDMSGVDFYPSNAKDEHEFTSTGADYGIAPSNTDLSSQGGTIKLHQWLCEGDPQNFNPEMFDEPYSESYFGPGQYPD